MAVGVVLPGHEDGRVGHVHGPSQAADELEDGLERLLGHAGPRRLDQGVVGLDPDPARAAQDLELGRRLDLAQLPDEGGAVPDVDLGELVAQLLDELQLPGQPAVPGAQGHRPLQGVELLVGVLRAELLGLEHRVEHPGPLAQARQERAELLGRQDPLDPRDLPGVPDEVERDPLAVGLLLAHGEEQDALLPDGRRRSRTALGIPTPVR